MRFMSNSPRIALAQATAILGNVSANAANHIALAKEAITEKADAIVFPELSLTGYTLRDLNLEVALNPETSELLSDLRTLSKQITIICGGVERTSNGGVYNSAFIFEDGGLKHTHHKIYPPTYGIFEEQRYFLRGNTARVFDSSKLGRIGVLVCEDLWHPSLPYLLTYQGAKLIVTIAASPTRMGETSPDLDQSIPANYHINREHHSTYARLFSVFMAFINRVGVEDGVNFWGGSELVAPSGEVVKRAKFFDEDLVITDLDHNAIERSRQHSRHMLDEDLLLTRQIFDETIRLNREK